MDKMRMETVDMVEQNIDKIGNVIKLRNDGFEGNTKNVLLFFYGKFEFFC